MKHFVLFFAALSALSLFGAVSESGPPRIVVTPSGTGAGNTGELRFKELVANGNHHTGFKAPDSLAASVIYTLPNADGTNGYVLSTNASGILSWVANGLGSVSSVALSMPAEFSVAGSPITTSGTFTVTKATQTANTVFAGPTSGGAAAPAFRALVEADIGTNTVNTAAIKDNNVTTAKILDANVTLAKITNITTDRLLGRDTASSGVTEQLTVGGGIEFTGSGGIQTSAFTGDVTKTAGGTATTIASNAVVTAKIADANVTYAKHSSEAIASLQRKNLAINPRFDIWQRGTSFTGPANNTYTADKIKYFKSGLMAHDVSRSPDVPTVAQAGVLANYSILVDCTTLDGSLASNEASSLRTVIEGTDFTHIAQRSFTISFWVKATKTGIYCVGVANSVGDRGYAGEYTVNVTDTWEKKTINVPASPSAGTWDYTTGVGLFVNFSLGGGTGNQITGGSWQTTTTNGFPITSNQVNACDSASNNFRMTLLQIEPGDNATPFEYRPIQEEMANSQRYCYSVSTVASNTLVGAGFGVSNTLAVINIHLPVPMRTLPVITRTPGDWDLSDGNTVAPATDISVSTAFFQGSSVRLLVTVGSGATQFRPCYLHGDGTSTGLLILDADF